MRPFAILSAWSRRLPDGFVKNLATLGPLGYLPKAPGTWGAAAGTIFHFAATMRLAPLYAFVTIFLLIALSIVICGEAEVRLKKHDPSEVVLDEFVAMPVCFLFVPLKEHPFGWALICTGFLLFRFFDIMKPLGIRAIQRLPSGAGVVFDDVAAALCTCACLHLGLRLAEVL